MNAAQIEEEDGWNSEIFPLLKLVVVVAIAVGLSVGSGGCIGVAESHDDDRVRRDFSETVGSVARSQEGARSSCSASGLDVAVSKP